MRVLFTTIAEKSHVIAMTPMAWALAAAGHEVRVASGPAMVDAITATGLTAVPVGTDHSMHEMLAEHAGHIENEMADWSDPFVDQQAFDKVLTKYQAAVPFGLQPYNDVLVDDLVDLARAWRPDLVVWDPLTYAGPVAAQVVGAAHARLLWCVDIYSTMRTVFAELSAQQPPSRRQDPLADWLGRLLDIHGGAFDETVTTGHWSIDQVPGSIQLPLDVNRVPVRYVAYNGRAEVPEWLRTPAERPRVCLTPGISFGDVLGMHLVPMAESIEAMADLDVEVVATIGDDDVDKLGTLPDNVRAAGFVPLHALAPTCSAVIHHGGFGTWSTAALYGVPQLVVTIRHGDLWAKARRTAEAGAGLLRHATEVTVDSLREDVTRLLTDPAIGEAAGRLRHEMAATPSPVDVVPEIERLTCEHQSVPAPA